MFTTLRAAFALAMLAGFYGYVLVVAAVFLSPGLLAATASPANDAAAAVLILFGLFLAGTVVWATWRVSRTAPPLKGVVLSKSHAPELWSTVRRLANAVDTRPPDEIRLVSEATATVLEHGRLLGLIGGRRYLYIGLPLLSALTVSQLRAVLAHELGHYSRQHVRWAEPVYRGRTLIQRTITQVGWWRDLTLVPLRPYAYLYLLVSASVCRRQEVEADLASARLAGRSAATSMLRDLPGLAVLWRHYLARYVSAGLRMTALAPTDVLSSFPKLLRAQADTWEQLRSQPPSTKRPRWDSHPSPAERVAQIQQAPEGLVQADDRPAEVLVRQLDLVVPELEAQTFAFEGRTRVPIEQYLTAVGQAAHQHNADRLYRCLARVAGYAPPNLDTALDLLEAGRYPELAAGLVPASTDAATARLVVQQALASAFAVTITNSGAGRWRHSWSTPPQLVGTADVPIDYQSWAKRAIAGEVASVRQELLAHGGDLSATAVRTTPNPAGARGVAGLLDVRVNRKPHDVAIFDLGLLLLPRLKTWKLQLFRKRMLAALRDPVSALADIPGARFIPFEEMVSARLVRRLYLRREFQLYTGERLAIWFGTRVPPVGPGWPALDEAVKMLTPPADDPATLTPAPHPGRSTSTDVGPPESGGNTAS
jgi:Zn-dependent protease with chaperone function